MPKLTRQQAIIQELESIGFERVQSRSTKYVVLKRPETKNMYIGRKGAMRYGRTVSDSISINDPTAALVAMRRTYKDN